MEKLIASYVWGVITFAIVYFVTSCFWYSFLCGAITPTVCILYINWHDKRKSKNH